MEGAPGPTPHDTRIAWVARVAMLLIVLSLATLMVAPVLIQRRITPLRDQVQNSQRRIARQEGTLYWDWSAMMGGNCGAQFWLKQKVPYMRPDLVHMSPEGYAASADALYMALLAEMDKAAKRLAAAPAP